MRSGTIAFLGGVLLLLQCAYLPNLGIILLLLCLSLLLLGLLFFQKSKRIRILISLILFFLAGFIYTNFYAAYELNKAFSPALEKKNLIIQGFINSLPINTPRSSRFRFVIKQINSIKPNKVNYCVRLTWFQPMPVVLKVGDHWQFMVRLQRPHGLINPGGFDFERWIFQNKLQATGYVVNSPANQLIISNWYFKPIDRVRQRISDTISIRLKNHPYAGLIKALVIGVTHEITVSQWQVFRVTGTSHLVAISGLHIGLITGFLFLMVDFLWRYFCLFGLYYPSRTLGCLAGLIGALGYSTLAGFAIPTQRALVMTTVFMICSLGRRNLPPWNALCLALLIVILWDPFAVMTASFWLSFGAVATIIYGLCYRVAPSGLWWKWGRTQWVVTIGLIPLTLFLFQQASLISLIANIIAIPWIGIFVVPLCLMGSLLLLLPGHLGDYFLQLAGFLLKALWPILNWLANQPHPMLSIHIPNYLLLLLTGGGILLLLAPRGFPQRGLGFILLMPLWFYRYPIPEDGKVWFTLLDVGQGLAAIVQTERHLLIYDTGPKFSTAFDTGSTVLLPFLKTQGRNKIDILVISHGDNDHIGGSQALINSLPITTILTSVPEKFPNRPAVFCRAGQHWRWDNVDFDMLYPVPMLRGLNNNSSCVLRVSTGNFHLLLTGDIEKFSENYLLKYTPDQLATNIMVAPHHGSRTSSTPDFIKAVRPDMVLISAGYLNRYHLPSKLVIAHYLENHARVYDTVSGGALTFRFGKEGLLGPPEQYRQINRHFWN